MKEWGEVLVKLTARMQFCHHTPNKVQHMKTLKVSPETSLIFCYDTFDVNERYHV